jgi:acetyl-CoA C-acetyltransferase
MLDAYIYDGLRTPIGRHAGKLAPVRPDDLAADVLKEVVARNRVSPTEISDVVMGCVTQAGEDSRNVARFAALLAGLPPTTPGVTVNRLCASGLQAVVDAARAITCGEGELYVAGGVESMSRAPYVMGKSDSPFSREVKMFDTTIGARFPNPKVVKQFGNHAMPETGDNVAKDFGITREQADEFALASQQKYAKLEADHLLAAPRAVLRRTDHIRLMGWPAPLLVFFYTLIAKRCILDGWPGWLYVLQRMLAETMIAVEVVDRRLRFGRSGNNDPQGHIAARDEIH